MAGDPVPVVLRKAPYNFFPGMIWYYYFSIFYNWFEAGKIFLLTRNEIGGKCSAISVRDYDSALADNNLQIPNLQNILQHCVKHCIFLSCYMYLIYYVQRRRRNFNAWKKREVFSAPKCMAEKDSYPK